MDLQEVALIYLIYWFPHENNHNTQVYNRAVRHHLIKQYRTQSEIRLTNYI